MIFTYPPPTTETDTYLIASDWHSFDVNPQCVDRLIDVAMEIKPKRRRKLIILGDFLDVPYLMKRSDEFQKWIKTSNGIEEFFIPKFDEEIMWANQMLDRLQQVFSTIIFKDGNHDWRIDWFREERCPDAYKPYFRIDKALNLEGRGIDYIPYRKDNEFTWIDIGNKFSLTHGMFHGATCHKKHYEACGKSCVFGHVHYDDKKSFGTRGETKQAYSLPAMANLAMPYLKNVTNWTNGFGILHVKPNSNFHYQTFTIWDGQLVMPDGRIFG